MTSLKEVEALRAEAERLWALELEARRAAVAAEEAWRAAMKEYYDATWLERVGLRRSEE